MFEALAAAVEEVEVPPAGDALREVLDISDRLMAKTALALGHFDAAEGYEVDGATSATAWLRHHGGQSSRAAARLACLARRLQRLPVTATAWAEGALSVGQVEAIVANVAPRLVELFAEHEAEVVPALVELSVPDTAAAMAHWARCAEAIDEGAEPEQRRRSARASRTLDGRVELDASLDPEGGEVVLTALRLASTTNVDGEPRRPAERQGDALVDVCRFFLDHQSAAPGRRHRPHVNVVIDLEALVGGGPGTVLGGPVLDGASVRRLCCDAGVHRVVRTGRSSILDYGTTTRTVPAPLWSALVVRDQHCRFPGCDRPATWGEAHHVVHWADGGPTSLENLVLLCVRHHHLCHRPGWRARLETGAELVVTLPDGRTLRSRMPPPAGAQPRLVAA